jgi:hypothetical protein
MKGTILALKKSGTNCDIALALQKNRFSNSDYIE